MRVVVDTNVFVGACIGVGASNAVIRACLQHRVVPLMGEALLAEFEAVLGRDALFAKSRLDAAERSTFSTPFLRFANGPEFSFCGARTYQMSRTTT
jgi:predicted nucleic acid-binding protein